MNFEEKLLTRYGLAERWDTATRTLDRLRQSGQLPWIDLSGGQRRKPIVRFRLRDVVEYERKHRMFPGGGHNE